MVSPPSLSSSSSMRGEQWASTLPMRGHGSRRDLRGRAVSPLETWVDGFLRGGLGWRGTPGGVLWMAAGAGLISWLTGDSRDSQSSIRLLQAHHYTSFISMLGLLEQAVGGARRPSGGGWDGWDGWMRLCQSLVSQVGLWDGMFPWRLSEKCVSVPHTVVLRCVGMFSPSVSHIFIIVFSSLLCKCRRCRNLKRGNVLKWACSLIRQTDVHHTNNFTVSQSSLQECSVQLRWVSIHCLNRMDVLFVLWALSHNRALSLLWLS